MQNIKLFAVLKPCGKYAIIVAFNTISYWRKTNMKATKLLPILAVVLCVPGIALRALHLLNGF